MCLVHSVAMADAPDEADGDSQLEPRPTWVKVVGIVVLIALAVLVVVALTGGGGGEHGPGRHM